MVLKTAPVLQTLSLSKLAVISVAAHIGVVAGYTALLSHMPQSKVVPLVKTEDVPLKVHFLSSEQVSRVRHVKTVKTVKQDRNHSTSPSIKTNTYVSKTPKPQSHVTSPAPKKQAKTLPAHAVDQVTPLEAISTRQAYMPEPVYPKSALRRHQSGLVVVLFHLNALGQVVKANVTSSSGVEVLDQAALDAVKTWRFPKVVAKSHGKITAPIRFVTGA